MIKNQMKILDFFPNKTIIKEHSSLATLNRFLTLIDLDFTRTFLDTHKKGFRKLKKIIKSY